MSTQNKPATGVLLMAYGSPHHITEVKPYLKEVKGKDPSQELLETIESRYRRVGGKTPLYEITSQQAAELQKAFDQNAGQGRYKVYVGMKHWHPFIKDVIKKMEADGIEKFVALALAPHYSYISVGGYERSVGEALKELSHPMAVIFIKNWHTNQYLIGCILAQLRDAIQKFHGIAAEKIYVIFTAHSLPEKILAQGDPYCDQLQETSRMVAQALGISSWEFAFQSAGHTGEKWLGPDVQDVLRAAGKKGFKDVLICSIGFVSDHLEILYDIDIECQELANKNGMRLFRTESRNTHPLFIHALHDIVASVTW